MLRLISDILTFKPQGRGTDLGAGARPTCRRWPSARRSPSSSRTSSPTATRSRCASWAASTTWCPVVIADPLEEALPRAGPGGDGGPGDGRALRGGHRDPRVRGRFARAMQAARDERRRLFKKLELDTWSCARATTTAARWRGSSARAPGGWRHEAAAPLRALLGCCLRSRPGAAQRSGAGADAGGASPGACRRAASRARRRSLLGEPFIYELVAHPRRRTSATSCVPPPELGAFELLEQHAQRQDGPDGSTTTFRLKLSAFELGELHAARRSTFDVAAPGGRAGASRVPGIEVEVARHAARRTPRRRARSSTTSSRPARCPSAPGGCSGRCSACSPRGLLAWALRALKRAAPRRRSPPSRRRCRWTCAPARRWTRSRPRTCPPRAGCSDFYFRLSEILRGYLGERYGFEALECTSPSCSTALRRLHTPGLPDGRAAALRRRVRPGEVRQGRRRPRVLRAALDFAYALVARRTVPPSAAPDSRMPPDLAFHSPQALWLLLLVPLLLVWALAASAARARCCASPPRTSSRSRAAGLRAVPAAAAARCCASLAVALARRRPRPAAGARRARARPVGGGHRHRGRARPLHLDGGRRLPPAEPPPRGQGGARRVHLRRASTTASAWWCSPARPTPRRR